MLPTTSFSVLLLLKLPCPLQVSKGSIVLGCWNPERSRDRW